MEQRRNKPEKGNKFYNTINNGGLSRCIKGNPTDSECDVLANCVGYACGRFNEIIGNMVYPQLNCNAENFIKRIKDYELKLEVVDYPTLGGIMVMEGAGNLAGHVFIVEEIIDKNTIITSESSYRGSSFYVVKRNNNNGRWGMNSNYSFIGCIVNPIIGDVHYEEQTKSLEELAKEVINGLWGKGEERKTRLTESGYNYEEVQDLVNEILKPKDDSLNIGDKVYVISTGKATSYGEYNTAMSNYEGVIANDLTSKNRPYPYLVTRNNVCIGWYKKESLKKM